MHIVFSVLGVVALGSKENWKVESVQNDRAKTILPDLFENEVYAKALHQLSLF